uniref:Uncharacterized protein n=1 Tax=Tanacetum cinerariifolium TaxID=118510 RepID=A0A6L2NVD9_TANCI|nr:hypothetical protein [Tanacetum cinerariifolium]
MVIIEKEEKELHVVLQNLTQNVMSRPESSAQKSTQASNSNTQRSSSPSPGRKEFMKREEDIEKVLQNSSHGKPKWYVIFNRPFRGIYTDRAIASTRKSVSHKSYLTKEATEKALEESYKTIATEETQKMKNIPTAKEKEEMRRPTVENFQRQLDSLMNYNEVHATMLFYPKKRRNIGPKAVFMPEASPKDIYDYYVQGLVDMIYINGETLKELQEFPLKEQKLLVPSITVAQLGVSNKGYPDKDEKIECAPPTIDDLERIDEVQLKVLSDFEDQIELFSGLLAPLPEDLKQQLCSYMTRNTRHHCYYCLEGTSSSPIIEG